MTSLPFYVLACGGHRVNEPTFAAGLFTGLLFKASLEFARSRVCDERIVILTGSEGLLRLDTYMVRPRFVFLPTDVWADQVRDQLGGDFKYLLDLDPQIITILGYDVFNSTLAWAWEQVKGEKPQFHSPLAKVRSDQQVEWLRTRTGEGVPC